MCVLPVDTFAYCELNRLPTAYLTGAGAGVNFNHTYAYNHLGNIASWTGMDLDMTDTKVAANTRLQAVTRIAQSGSNLFFKCD
jgi:hypothetical protein